MLSEGRKSKGEQFKWGEELIFPAEELSSLILLPKNLMKFWVSGGGKLFRILLIPRGTSPGQVLQSLWQQLTDLCPILNRFQQYKEGPPDASVRVVLGFSCGGRSWGLPGKGLWRNPSCSQIATFLSYISLYCVQPIIMSFWWSCNSLKLQSIGYNVEVFLVLAWGLVYPLRAGQEKYRIHLSLSVPPLPLFAPTACFLFLFPHLKDAAALPACTHFIPPWPQPLFTYSRFHWQAVTATTAHKPIFQLKRTQRPDLSGVNYCFSATDIRQNGKK